MSEEIKEWPCFGDNEIHGFIRGGYPCDGCCCIQPTAIKWRRCHMGGVFYADLPSSRYNYNGIPTMTKQQLLARYGKYLDEDCKLKWDENGRIL